MNQIQSNLLKLLNYSLSDTIRIIKDHDLANIFNPNLTENMSPRNRTLSIINATPPDYNNPKVLSDLYSAILTYSSSNLSKDPTLFRNTKKQILDTQSEIISLKNSLQLTYNLINNESTPSYKIDPYTQIYTEKMEKIQKIIQLPNN